tara:strand:+ start:916 stop:1452 length:537 start_codon:yes stop_codon:yes gene_type:complete
MFDLLRNFFDSIVAFDLIYVIITSLSLIKCTKKGFVLSLLEAAKWLLAIVITLILFPRLKPYVINTIDNEYVLDIILGIGIFVVVFVLIKIINKIISGAVNYLGLGKFDTLFGFFFGFIRGYVICLCIFSTINIFYNYNNWPLNIKSSWTFPLVQKGSNYLMKEFPNEKQKEEKIKNI